MPHYRRYRLPGRPLFLTLVTAGRAPELVDHWPGLREAIRRVQARRPFRLDALVVLPDHCHCILALPDRDSDYATRINQIKGAFSREVPDLSVVTASRRRRGERGVWQRRYWEHTLQDEEDYRRHFDYLHYNPVKHGYVARCREWPYSTFHRWVERGIYAPDWGCGVTPRGVDEVAAGE
ncbi:MAG: transposase [Nitrospirota bacterium]